MRSQTLNASQQKKLSVFWFRRDLRTADNCGFFAALHNSSSVLPVFIFDSDILSQLKDKNDKRVSFIHEALSGMDQELRRQKSGLLVLHDRPLDAFKKLVTEYPIEAVYTNGDYEPYARKRDQEVGQFLRSKNIDFFAFKDQVVFETTEIVKDDQKPYLVFTPYSRKWRATLKPKEHLKHYGSEKLMHKLLAQRIPQMPSLADIGFLAAPDVDYPHVDVTDDLIRNYQKQRDVPGVRGTSHLGLHLRFGTISTRALVRRSQELSDTFVSELIWREFFMMLLWHFPQTVDHCFRSEYEKIEWRNDCTEFDRWCKGETGYPLVDAGMRELNQTGFMHNRVRMVVASFLCKHLLIDWRWGERYFAKKLLDYDLSANVGNWQWSAGCGCDAAPYFRVFNPESQAEKFDPSGVYQDLWVPERNSLSYPKPIVDHKFARERCLKVFAKALKGKPK